MSVRFTVIVPARYASTRLPGKALELIGDRPLIQHVYEQARASGAASIHIATDHEDIRRAAEGFGASVCMTSSEFQSGTERIAAASEQLGLGAAEIVVNLQCDEPEMPPALIRQVAGLLADNPDAAIATLCARLDEPVALYDPNIVKVVMDRDGFALYFSRAPIPWARDEFGMARPPVTLPGTGSWYRHIGLYAYRVDTLRDFVRMAPCAIETIESLEQLRALYHGARIRVQLACVSAPVGIDTSADLQRVRRAFANGARAAETHG